jgi:hypothetical protein
MFVRISKCALKLRHAIAAFLGTVHYTTCLENGCEEYCGTSPTGWQMFWKAKFRKNQLEHIVNNSQEKHRL